MCESVNVMYESINVYCLSVNVIWEPVNSIINMLLSYVNLNRFMSFVTLLMSYAIWESVTSLIMQYANPFVSYL